MKRKIYTIPDQENPPTPIGQGEKGLCIVIDEKDYHANETTLLGLIKAIKMDAQNDVFIYPMNAPFALSKERSMNKIRDLILMGVSTQSVGLNIQAKKYFTYKMESMTLLCSESLTSINADKSKKMALWQCLQNQFLK